MERKIEKEFEKTAQMLAAYHYKKTGEKLVEISYQVKGSIYFDTAIKLDKKRTKSIGLRIMRCLLEHLKHM